MQLDFLWVPQHMMNEAPFYLLVLLIVVPATAFDMCYYIIKVSYSNANE